MKTSRNKKRNDRLFFAFPDGVYDYVCAECTALCCRGQGFGGNLRREMTQLLSLYPALGHSAVSKSGDIVSFATPSGRCHFLDGDNLCRIEKEHGKTLKPGVCSLFPFNSLTRIGKVVAVKPHFMCPLRLTVPAAPGTVAGTHSQLEGAVRDSGLLSEAPKTTHKSQGWWHPSMDAEAVLERETVFRDACTTALGQQAFGSLVKDHSANPTEFTVLINRAAQILGLNELSASHQRDMVDDLLLALASPLRLGLLHLDSEAILRTLALSELVLRRVITLSNQPPTLQGSHQIITSAWPALRLLARGDEPLTLHPRASAKSPPFDDPELTFSAFIALRGLHNAMGALTALEKAIQPELSVVNRSILLAELGHKLDREIIAPPMKKAIGAKQR